MTFGDASDEVAIKVHMATSMTVTQTMARMILSDGDEKVVSVNIDLYAVDGR